MSKEILLIVAAFIIIFLIVVEYRKHESNSSANPLKDTNTSYNVKGDSVLQESASIPEQHGAVPYNDNNLKNVVSDSAPLSTPVNFETIPSNDSTSADYDNILIVKDRMKALPVPPHKEIYIV